jgi:hypothetical protein
MVVNIHLKRYLKCGAMSLTNRWLRLVLEANAMYAKSKLNVRHVWVLFRAGVVQIGDGRRVREER